MRWRDRQLEFHVSENMVKFNIISTYHDLFLKRAEMYRTTA